MGAFGCHGNQSFDPDLPENLIYAAYPHPIKFEQEWPTGLRDTKFEIVDDDGRTDDDDKGSTMNLCYTTSISSSCEPSAQVS